MLVAHNFTTASTITSPLNRGGATEEIKLPFDYHHLTDEEKAHSISVPETFYTVLGNGSPVRSAIVGPLQPCVLVAVRHEKTDKALVFHVNAVNRIQDIFSIMEEEFGPSVKSEDLRVKLFTKSLKHESSEVLEAIKHTPEKQKQFFMVIFADFMEKYNFKKSQMQAIIFSSVPSPVLSLYFRAEKSVFIDKDLNLYSISLLAERIFNTMPINLGELEKECFLIQMGTNRVLGKYLDEYSPSHGMSLSKIPPSEMGLAKLSRF